MQFRIALDVFRGPLDLLLYLVRKEELDVTELSLTKVTQQFLEYIGVLKQIDVDAVGEFLDMASMLIESKSRLVLPGEEEVEQELEDPRQELVRRLLEYKQYRDAASMLEERGHEWGERFTRVANDLPSRQLSPADQPIREIELWDLVSAFGRVLRERHTTTGPENIRYDETPIHIYMRRIDEQLRREGRVPFTGFFDVAVHKSAMIGMFLAVLELVRHQHANADQEELFGEIWLKPGKTPLPTEFDAVTDYEQPSAA